MRKCGDEEMKQPARAGFVVSFKKSQLIIQIPTIPVKNHSQ